MILKNPFQPRPFYERSLCHCCVQSKTRTERTPVHGHPGNFGGLAPLPGEPPNLIGLTHVPRARSSYRMRILLPNPWELCSGHQTCCLLCCSTGRFFSVSSGANAKRICSPFLPFQQFTCLDASLQNQSMKTTPEWCSNSRAIWVSAWLD